jgi:hypothetical protein
MMEKPFAETLTGLPFDTASMKLHAAIAVILTTTAYSDRQRLAEIEDRLRGFLSVHPSDIISAVMESPKGEN